MTTYKLPTIEKLPLIIAVHGETPLVSNRFSDESLEAMENKQTGKATAARKAKDTQACAFGSRHLLDGRIAHPSVAFRSAIIEGHAKGLSYTKKALEQGFRCVDALTPIECPSDKIIVRRDALKNSNGIADLRYRMEYRDWSAKVNVIVYPATLSVEQFLQAFVRAGEHVGIGPQYMRKWFGFGRFRVLEVESPHSGVVS